MLYFERKECKECGSKLWSDYSKKLELCPECKDIDAEQNLELESKFENLRSK